MADTGNEKAIDEEKEIDDIIEQLQLLTVRLQKLRTQKTKQKNTKEKYKVGDVVEITNNYKGMKGTVGSVFKIGNIFTTIKLQDGNKVRRASTNIKFLRKG